MTSTQHHRRACRRRIFGPLLVLLVTSALPGCNYLRGRLDDFNDIYTLGIGGTIIRDSPYPSGLGVYVEATEMMHVGAMFYRGYMLELDRRGAAVTRVEEDLRWGLGPFKEWRLKEHYEPADAYKAGDVRRWQQRMDLKEYHPLLVGWERERGLEGPVPAKRMRFDDIVVSHYPRGWQDWGYVGVDVAISEPFVLHAGIRVKAGIDLSQILDFLIGIFGADLYEDDLRPEEMGIVADETEEEPGER